MAKGGGSYSKIYRTFWTSPVAHLCRQSPDVWGVVMHLMTSKHSNMIGLYQLPVMYLAHETGLTTEGAEKALERLSGGGFCAYDKGSETVWVYEMAKHQVGAALKPGDNNVKGVWNALAEYSHSSHYAGFWGKYCAAYHLDSSPLQAPSGVSASPLQAPWKPVSVPVSVPGALTPTRARAPSSKPANEPRHATDPNPLDLVDVTSALVSSYLFSPTGAAAVAKAVFDGDYSAACEESGAAVLPWRDRRVAEPFLRLAAYCELHGGDPHAMMKVALSEKFRLWDGGRRDVLTEPSCLLPAPKLATFLSESQRVGNEEARKAPWEASPGGNSRNYTDETLDAALGVGTRG